MGGCSVSAAHPTHGQPFLLVKGAWDSDPLCCVPAPPREQVVAASFSWYYACCSESDNLVELQSSRFSSPSIGCQASQAKANQQLLLLSPEPLNAVPDCHPDELGHPHHHASEASSCPPPPCGRQVACRSPLSIATLSPSLRPQEPVEDYDPHSSRERE